MVNFSTIAIIGGLGLLIFFKEDVSKFLNQFKGFGQDFGKVELPDININVPDFGLPEAFAETGKTISTGLGEAGENINQFGIDVQKNIGESIAGAQAGIDQSIKETQESFEQFGQDVQTNIGIISTGIGETGKGITDFFGGLIPQKEITTVSETAPTITSRRSGTTTRFGGQTAPKEILTKEVAVTSDVIKSEQPNLELVSPFLKSFQTIEEKPESTTIVSRRTGTTGGRWVGR